MIVMKFGGSSVESAAAIRRVAAIVREHLSRKPVVVVSAMGKTTSRLLELAREAALAHTYFVSRNLAELREYHFEEAASAIDGAPLDRFEWSLKRHFRDLHSLLAGISEDGRELTPALTDEIAAFGERISSELLAAAIESSGVGSVHVDARKLILTDNRHTQATPLYWETYARLRRAPELFGDRVPVMGGFIASNESGATTTLGRGGSDLSASIVGAGISAEEIQIWTDVDGMLTSDPRVSGEVHRLRAISYEEAMEMARAGAKVLHPDSVMPAIRQHIPIAIRNSRNPGNEGTRIVPAAAGSGMVKSIACRQDVMVLEICPENPGDVEAWTQSLQRMCDGQESPECIRRQGNAVFLALPGAGDPERLKMPFEGAMRVRIHPHSAILTLVGDRVASALGVDSRVRNTLKEIPAMAPRAASEHALVVIVPQGELARSAALLHREFFGQPDPSLFAPCRVEAAVRTKDAPAVETRAVPVASRRFRLVLQPGR